MHDTALGTIALLEKSNAVATSRAGTSACWVLLTATLGFAVVSVRPHDHYTR